MVDLSWRGGQLDRLLDARHASLVEQVMAILESLGWERVGEYTFNHFGEKGTVDILAWNAARRALLIIEIKTEIVDLQDLLSTLDRRARLVPMLVARERGWSPLTVGVVLVMAEGSVTRAAVGRHRSTFGAALPCRNVEVRRWLRDPVPPGLRGVWFLPPIHRRTLMETRGGPRRIRATRTALQRSGDASKRAEFATRDAESGAKRSQTAGGDPWAAARSSIRVTRWIFGKDFGAPSERRWRGRGAMAPGAGRRARGAERAAMARARGDGAGRGAPGEGRGRGAMAPGAGRRARGAGAGRRARGAGEGRGRGARARGAGEGRAARGAERAARGAR